jgi:DNA-binding transcriptional MerR regulator
MMVQNLSDILEDIDYITKAGLFYSPINTKNIYPPVKQEFGESTIYKAFIAYCKFNTIFPVPEDLVKYCTEKPANIKPNESLSEMMAKLKNDGRNYTNASLVSLFQLVSRRNIVNASVIMPTGAPIQRIRALMDEIDNSEEETEREAITLELRNKLEQKLDTFDLTIQSDDDKKNSRDFKNYIARENDGMRASITKFISENNNLPGSKQNKINSILQDIVYFNMEEGMQ